MNRKKDNDNYYLAIWGETLEIRIQAIKRINRIFYLEMLDRILCPQEKEFCTALAERKAELELKKSRRTAMKNWLLNMLRRSR